MNSAFMTLFDPHFQSTKSVNFLKSSVTVMIVSTKIFKAGKLNKLESSVIRCNPYEMKFAAN